MTDSGIVTYRQLAKYADDFAAKLGPHIQLLAVQAANAPQPIIAYLGALRAGIPVIMHADGASGRQVLAGCPPDASYAFDEDAGAWRLVVEPFRWRNLPHPDLALLLSTSGSTGSPKLVRLSAANLQANAESIGTYLELGPGERSITSLPLSYSYGLSVLNSHLARGGSIVLAEASVASDQFRSLVERHGVTSVAGVPYSYELMERSGLLRDFPPSIRTFTQAGGRMAPEMISRVADLADAGGARLFVMYGQTEASARIAYVLPEDLKNHIGSIGGPIPGGELWIEDAKGKRAPVGSEGELVYRGPNVMMGYATSRKDLSAPAGPNILRTGDVALEVVPGLFRITGRKSRFVKPYGLRVGLDDIEDRCREAGVEAFATGDDDLIVVASSVSAAQAVRATVLGLGLPTELFSFLELETIPRLPGGKPDYPTILQLGRDGLLADSASGEGIAEVEALFARLARRRSPDPDASFEALGGDSLSYVQCSLAVEAALGVAPEGWERMTLAELRALAAARSGAPSNWPTVQADIVVRSLAILQVLALHAFDGFAGGADILMVLAGFSWARFQRKRLLVGNAAKVFIDFVRRYLLAYIAILIAVSVVNRTPMVNHLLFTSTFHGDWGGILNIYWFIESLAWCVAITCLVFCVPQVRAIAAKFPLASGLAFVAAALALRLAGAVSFDAASHVFRSPDQMLLYFAVGWAVALARGAAVKSALFAGLIVTSALAWGWSDTHVFSMAIAGALLVGLPRIRLPKPLHQAITLVASASFYIYLLNALPMYLTDRVLDARFGPYAVPQIMATLILGIGLFFFVEALNSRGPAKRWLPRRLANTTASAT